jgi:hypothetical protein
LSDTTQSKTPPGLSDGVLKDQPLGGYLFCGPFHGAADISGVSDNTKAVPLIDTDAFAATTQQQSKPAL